MVKQILNRKYINSENLIFIASYDAITVLITFIISYIVHIPFECERKNLNFKTCDNFFKFQSYDYDIKKDPSRLGCGAIITIR